MMKSSTGFSMHIDLAGRELGHRVDLPPAGLESLRVVQPLPAEVSRGAVESVALGHGVGYFSFYCEDAAHEFRLRTGPTHNRFVLPFHLSRDPGEAGIAGMRRPIALSRSDSYILGPSVIGVQTVRPGTVTHEMCLLADPAVVDSCFADLRQQLPAILKGGFSKPTGEPFFLSGSTTAAIGLALRQMLTCGLRGGLARLYLEAKVIEIIAMRLAQVEAKESEVELKTLTSRDVAVLEEARHILLSYCTEPPTISELARLVGMNRTKLKAGFRRLFGTTVFGLVRSQRMQMALELMQEGVCNVTEAAHTVGYNCPGAFATAFKAEFGFSPRLARALKPSDYRTAARALPPQLRPLA
ncbi:MAG: AraC family transcriptional regulator [Spirochaetaceae bacterium]|nr:MAG: AraC family transcriptional regulator [Spirochaetaceae bacterium]